MKNLISTMSGTALFFGATLFNIAPSHADGAYELTVVRPGLNQVPTVYRTNVASGQVAYVAGGTAFLDVKDPQSIPPGNYHLYFVTSEDKKGSFWLYRLDQQSGRTWYISNSTWYEISSPK